MVVERLLLTLWVGALWGVGYLAVPQLFNLLENRALAGTLAGELFTLTTYLSLVVAALLLVIALYRVGRGYLRSWRCGLLLVMVIAAAVSEFILHPQVAELRAAGLPTSLEGSRFAMLHGISSLLFLFNSLAGAVLVAVGVVSVKRGD